MNDKPKIMSKLKRPNRRVPFDNSLCVFKMMEMDKRELVEEIVWLRENSKDALQKAWKEIEYLRRKCVDHMEAKAKLTAALKENRLQGEAWRLRFLAAEKVEKISSRRGKSRHDNSSNFSRSPPIKDGGQNDIYSVDDNMRSSQEKKLLSKMRNRIWPWSSGDLTEMENDANNRVFKNIPCSRQEMSSPPIVLSNSKRYTSDRYKELRFPADDTAQQFLYPDRNTSISSSALPDESTQKGSDRGILDLSFQKMPEEKCVNETIVHSDNDNTGKSFLSNSDVKSREDLSLILSSRDDIIVSLEQTLHQQLKNMQNMQAEMKCLMETQKIREKRLCMAHRQKEERLQRLLKSRLRCQNSANPLVERLRSLIFENSELKPHNKEEKYEKEEKEYCSPCLSNKASLDLCGANVPPRQGYGAYTVERYTLEELSLILSSRDNIIASLEQTVTQQLMKLQTMQAEMI